MPTPEIEKRRELANKLNSAYQQGNCNFMRLAKFVESLLIDRAEYELKFYGGSMELLKPRMDELKAQRQAIQEGR